MMHIKCNVVSFGNFVLHQKFYIKKNSSRHRHPGHKRLGETQRLILNLMCVSEKDNITGAICHVLMQYTSPAW